MKLLNRTVRSYLIYSILLVLVCTPVIYFSVKWLFIREIDHELKSHRNDFFESLPYIKSKSDSNFFFLMNKEFVIEPFYGKKNIDTIYTEKVKDEVTVEMTEYRVFKSTVVFRDKKMNLIIRESLVSSSSLVMAIMGIQVALLCFLIAGFVWINRNLSKSIWRPFYVILNILKKYKIEQDPVPQLPSLPTAEFRELTLVVTQLINKSHEAFLNQKEFTENASHELQTPLAICRNKLEMLAQTKGLTEEQAELVESLLNATDRITRLCKNLLLLAKIENRQFAKTQSDILIAEIIRKVVSLYKKQTDSKDLKVRMELADSKVKGNPVLVEVMLNNLIANSIRYTPPNGEIFIECKSGSFVIRNSGEPLENPEKLFNRFYRESRTMSGSGLGLSIVRKIAEVYDYQVNYKYADKQHVFSVLF